MAMPRSCCAVVLIVLLFAACGREEDPPSRPQVPQGHDDRSQAGTPDELPPSESAPAADFIGMDMATFVHEIEEVTEVERQPRHVISYQKDSREMIAMRASCGDAEYVFLFADRELASICKTTYERFAADSYEDLIFGLSDLPSMSSDEFCASCFEEAHKYDKYLEPLPLPAQVIAALDDNPVESGLKKWDATKISLGDSRDRVESLFGIPTEFRVERDEMVLLYKTTPPERPGYYLEITVWLKDDRVTRLRTDIKNS